MVLLCHLISRIIPPNLFCSLKCTKLQLWYTLRSHRTTGLILGMLSVFESFSIFRKAMDSSGRDVWLSNGTYWKVRENPGFANTNNLELWWINRLGPFGGIGEGIDELSWDPTFYHCHLICTPSLAASWETSGGSLETTWIHWNVKLKIVPRMCSVTCSATWEG